MICPICRCGHTRPGFASVTLERDSTTLLFKDVPAQVCDNCGEEFIVESEQIKPGIVLDYDEAGNVVGIEVLSAGKPDNAPLKQAA